MDNNNQNTILIIDDDETNIKVLVNTLKSQEFKTITARNGTMGLQRAKFSLPDLILLDVMMPDIDGFAVCQQLKQDPTLTHIPIIFLTAKVEKVDIIAGLKLGAVDYITKPFSREELLTRVKTHITLQNQKKELQIQAEKLKQANEQLTQLNRDKNEFLGVTAHELRNPLSIILNATQLIKEAIETEQFNNKPRINKLLNFAIISTERAFNLVTNLLDVNVIESGQTKVNLRTVNILPILNQLVAEYTQKAAPKNITIHFKPTSSRYFAYVDIDIVHRILDNLISNAVKYSPFDKNIYIRIFITENKTICCEVEDEGPGLSQAEQRKLFKKFSRLTPTPTNKEGSTGLGLFIVQKLINTINSNVWCKSELDKGSKFVVEFPIPSKST